MNIEQWPIDRPIPYARNARKISDAAVDKVAASLKEFGWRQPIVVDTDGVVIAGHTRLLAAKKLGLKQVPVHVATELTPGQVKAYRLMDNRSHEEATWDFDLLGPEMLDLQALGLDLNLTGFDDGEIAGFLAGMDADGTSGGKNGTGSLSERFLVPPFSVLDARQGYWQERKREWLALGIRSEIGRGENALGFSETVNLTQAGKNPNRHLAIPGGGTGKNSAYMFKTANGYKSPKQMSEEA